MVSKLISIKGAQSWKLNLSRKVDFFLEDMTNEIQEREKYKSAVFKSKNIEQNYEEATTNFSLSQGSGYM